MSFALSAKLDSVTLEFSHILRATLRALNGEWNAASLDLNDCLGNIDGQLVWGKQAFSRSAANVVLDVSNAPNEVLLKADLKIRNGTFQAAVVNLNECIANIDGIFKYRAPVQTQYLWSDTGTVVSNDPSSWANPSIIPGPTGSPLVQRSTVRLCICMSDFPPHLPHAPLSGIHPVVPLPPLPVDEGPFPPERAKGTISTLPPDAMRCTAISAKFTVQPHNQELRYTARTETAIAAFTAEVTLHYNSITEVMGTYPFSGLVSEAVLSLHLSNGVRIMGEITQGGQAMEIRITGTGSWG
ncbi:unnamed protein product, partial [Rhizoctonia solani]